MPKKFCDWDLNPGLQLPTELPLHNSGMRQITATHQPYDTIPKRPEGGIGWISVHLHLLDLLFYEEQNYQTSHSSLDNLSLSCRKVRDPFPVLRQADYPRRVSSL